MDRKKDYIFLLQVGKINYNLIMNAHSNNYWFTRSRMCNFNHLTLTTVLMCVFL